MENLTYINHGSWTVWEVVDEWRITDKWWTDDPIIIEWVEVMITHWKNVIVGAKTIVFKKTAEDIWRVYEVTGTSQH